jgi:hypothetical protein
LKKRTKILLLFAGGTEMCAFEPRLDAIGAFSARLESAFMSRRFEADTNALQTTGWSGPPDADDFPVRMKPL